MDRTERPYNEWPLCVVCQKHKVRYEHVICRACNEREAYGMLTSEETARLHEELQYRLDHQ